MERSMLGTRRKDRMRNKEIRERTGANDITEVVRKVKMSYADHLARNKNEEKWEKRATVWVPSLWPSVAIKYFNSTASQTPALRSQGPEEPFFFTTLAGFIYYSSPSEECFIVAFFLLLCPSPSVAAQLCCLI